MKFFETEKMADGGTYTRGRIWINLAEVRSFHPIHIEKGGKVYKHTVLEMKNSAPIQIWDETSEFVKRIGDYIIK